MALLRDTEDRPDELWCRADHGPHGYLSIAAHAHADALAIEMRVGGVDVLADPGTYCYGADPAWRAYFRSTLAHNTLEVGGVDQSLAAGPHLWTRQARAELEGLEGGFYIEPTVFKGDNTMRVFREEIFGPVLSVTTFSDYDEAIRIANDTNYGLGAGVWSRDANDAYRLARGIQAGRVWVNNYHAYPAHAAFGGYKQSGIGRETHKMMLDHYQQTKNVLVSYSPRALGLF